MIPARPVTPEPTECPKCGNRAAEIVCHLCKTLKPEWYALHPGDALNVIACVAVVVLAVAGVIE